MERGPHKADDQQPGAAVLAVLQQLWPEHPRVHCHRASSHDTADHQAEPADEGNERAPTRHEGDPGKVQERQAKGLPGNDEALQRAGRQSYRLPGAHGDPDAHLPRAVLGPEGDPAVYARATCRPVAAPLPVAAPRAPGRAARQLLPRPRPGRLRQRKSHPVPASRPGRRLDVADAEDDYHARNKPAAGVDAADDAVDAATDVRLLHFELRERARTILDRLESDRNRHTGVCSRLGPTGAVTSLSTAAASRRGANTGGGARG